MATVLRHLGTDQIQRIEQQPLTLITTNQCWRRHAANTKCRCCWTSANHQNLQWTGCGWEWAQRYVL